MKKISGKRLSILFAIMLPLTLSVFTIAFWSEVSFGWNLPETARNTSKDYFETDQIPNEPFIAWSITLNDDQNWKIVGVDTNGLRSFKSWLIIIAQNDAKETYILEEPFDYSRMRFLYRTLSVLNEDTNEESKQRMRLMIRDNKEELNYTEILESDDSTEFQAALQLNGFERIEI